MEKGNGNGNANEMAFNEGLKFNNETVIGLTDSYLNIY